ncbi:hypothetical protein M409DRAFT_58330, partial [Zasmidium cellare ATCC 36951]
VEIGIGIRIGFKDCSKRREGDSEKAQRGCGVEDGERNGESMIELNIYQVQAEREQKSSTNNDTKPNKLSTSTPEDLVGATNLVRNQIGGVIAAKGPSPVGSSASEAGSVATACLLFPTLETPTVHPMMAALEVENFSSRSTATAVRQASSLAWPPFYFRRKWPATKYELRWAVSGEAVYVFEEPDFGETVARGPVEKVGNWDDSGCAQYEVVQQGHPQPTHQHCRDIILIDALVDALFPLFDPSGTIRRHDLTRAHGKEWILGRESSSTSIMTLLSYMLSRLLR